VWQNKRCDLVVLTVYWVMYILAPVREYRMSDVRVCVCVVIQLTQTKAEVIQNHHGMCVQLDKEKI
jgi:hypothetical protein